MVFQNAFWVCWEIACFCIMTHLITYGLFIKYCFHSFSWRVTISLQVKALFLWQYELTDFCAIVRACVKNVCPEGVAPVEKIVTLAAVKQTKQREFLTRLPPYPFDWLGDLSVKQVEIQCFANYFHSLVIMTKAMLAELILLNKCVYVP